MLLTAVQGHQPNVRCGEILHQPQHESQQQTGQLVLGIWH